MPCTVVGGDGVSAVVAWVVVLQMVVLKKQGFTPKTLEAQVGGGLSNTRGAAFPAMAFLEV